MRRYIPRQDARINGVNGRDGRNNEGEGQGGLTRVGMVWGAVGGVVGFIVSLFGSFAGIIAAGFIGFSCGKRAAKAGKEGSGASSGLVGGALAAPLFVLGAAAGAIVAAQTIGGAEIATSLSGILDVELSGDEAWNLYLVGTAVAAIVQAGILIAVSTASAAWTSRKRPQQ